MTIITYKNNLITYDEFIKNTQNYDYVDGLIIPIIMTKDKQIIVFDDQITGIARTEILQSNTYNELQNAAIIKLEDFLKRIQQFKKRIIINAYPLYQVVLTEDNLQYINEQNTEYINLVNNIVKQFLNLKISLCTFNQPLLKRIKEIIINNKKGLIVMQEDLNYMDVDFYIIPPTMLDALIIQEELNRGKEVMISSFTSNDLSIINDYFLINPSPIKNRIFNQLTFVTAYPALFNRLFLKNNLK